VQVIYYDPPLSSGKLEKSNIAAKDAKVAKKSIV
jgi:hypothetical protein